MARTTPSSLLRSVPARTTFLAGNVMLPWGLLALLRIRAKRSVAMSIFTRPGTSLPLLLAVVISATAAGAGGGRIGFGEVRGRVVAAR